MERLLLNGSILLTLVVVIVCSAVNARHQSSSLGVFVVALHKEFSRFIIQTAFREWYNQETTNNTQDMCKSSFGSPVFLQSVYADGTSRHVNIGMVDFGREETSRRSRWEFRREKQFQLEIFRFVRRSRRTFDFSLGECIDQSEGKEK